MTNDIIDRIDELVDEQLAEGEPENGFDFDNPDFPRCWHCNRHWHGLPITQKIASMYSRGSYDEDYRVDTDDSPVLCPGSDFIGPVQTQSSGWGYGGHARNISWSVTVDRFSFDRIREAMQRMEEAFIRQAEAFAETVLRLNTQIDALWEIPSYSYHIVEPEIQCTEPPPDVDVRFEPQNWHLEIQSRAPRLWFPVGYADTLRIAVANRWSEFTAPGHPIPASPGYDFSGYDQDAHGPWLPVQHQQA